MEIIKNIPFTLDRAATAKKLHISPQSRHADMLDQILPKIQDLLKPSAAFKTAFVYEKSEDAVKIENIAFKSRILRVNLDEVGKVFPYVITCGQEFDEISQSCTDLLYKYYLDELANMVLGLSQEYLNNLLGERYSLGKTSRMNPGSLQDWPIDQQRQLFALFGEDEIKEALGVSLTSSFLMVPVKSVSGIIFQTEKNFKSCQLCPRETCPGRRAPYNKGLLQSYYD